MEFLVILIVIGSIYFIYKYLVSDNNNTEEMSVDDIFTKEEIESVVKVSYRSSSDSNEVDTGKIKKVTVNTWILNPNSNFPIKISNSNIETAKELKGVLDNCVNEEVYNNKKLVADLILRHSIVWEDLEEFLKEHRSVYLNTIDEMKNNSTEWSISSELDKKDLLKEFEEKALDKLKIRLSIDEELLYSDILPISDNLKDIIKKYGYTIFEFYLRNYEKRDVVKRIDADHRYRKNYEKLVELGLANRGNQIDIKDILSIMKIAEMEKLIDDLDHKKFHRKAEIVDYLSNLSDIDNRLRKNVSFRELFKLNDNSLFTNYDYDQVHRLVKRTKIVANMLVNTYTSGVEDYERHLSDTDDLSYIDGWEIDSWDTNCPYCKEMQQKKYKPNDRPKVPLHINCNCHVNSKWSD